MTHFPHAPHRPSSTRPLRRIALVAGAVALVLVTVLVTAFAGTESYDYDADDRLQRMTDEQQRSTYYVMDAADNMLSVDVGDRAAVPVITSVEPAGLRRGQMRTITISGQHLGFASLSINGTGLSISRFTRSPTRISFDLQAAADAALGPNDLVLADAVGSASAAIMISPALPVLTAEPAPLALPPDGSPRQLGLRLSSADNIDHLITLQSLEPAIAAPAVMTVTIPAGQTVVRVPVIGKSVGTTSLLLSSSEIAAISLPIFVTGEFRGLSTSHAVPVGVLWPQAPPVRRLPAGANSVALGIVRGAALTGLRPAALVRGSEGELVIDGMALPRELSVTALPADGLSFGAPVVADDGRSLRVPFVLAADASLNERELRVQSGTALLPWTDARHSRLNISTGTPVVESLRPYYAQPGQTLSLVIGGRRFDEASNVRFTPADGLTVEAPVVNAAGTELSLRVQIGPEASPGTRIVTVTTRTGSSAAEPTQANSFQLLGNAPEVFAPIGAPLLGVLRETVVPAQRLPGQAMSSSLGVAVGSVATRLLPRAAIVGQITRIRIEGHGLQAVDRVQLLPDTGLTVSAPQPAADGKSVSIDVTAALDAPRLPRRVLLHAGATRLAFMPAEADQLIVSEPLPELHSVSPNVAAPGFTLLTLRGINLQNAQQLRLQPPDGIAIDSLSWSANGRSATASLQIAPDAAPGPRTVVLSTLAGDTGSTPSLANTITLGARVVDGPGPLLSPAVGVQRDIAAAPQYLPVDTRAPALGILREIAPQPVARSDTAISIPLAVVRGAALHSVAPAEFSPGSTGRLTLRGSGFGAGMRVSLLPDTGISLGAAEVSADGSVLELPITVADDAPAVPRRVQVSGEQGELAFVDPRAGQIAIGAGPIALLSIDPIIVKQGDTVTLTLRGSRLRSATGIDIAPSEGITMDAGTPVWSTDALGEKLSLRIRVDPAASLGSRVVRVRSPGSLGTGTPLPANTLTVIAP